MIAASPALLAREEHIFARYRHTLASLVAEEVKAPDGDLRPARSSSTANVSTMKRPNASSTLSPTARSRTGRRSSSSNASRPLIDDQAAGLAGKIVSGAPRDSLHMIDVAFSQDQGQRPDIILADTGSYSDLVFGLGHLLGREYHPRWRTCPTKGRGALTAPRTMGR
jgi:TnpA family transposase